MENFNPSILWGIWRNTVEKNSFEIQFLIMHSSYGRSLIVTFLLVHSTISLKSRVLKVIEHFLDSSFWGSHRKSPIANEEWNALCEWDYDKIGFKGYWGHLKQPWVLPFGKARNFPICILLLMLIQKSPNIKIHSHFRTWTRKCKPLTVIRHRQK